MLVILTGPPYSHTPMSHVPYDGVWDQFEPQQTSHGAVCGAGLVLVTGALLSTTTCFYSLPAESVLVPAVWMEGPEWPECHTGGEVAHSEAMLVQPQSSDNKWMLNCEEVTWEPLWTRLVMIWAEQFCIRSVEQCTLHCSTGPLFIILSSLQPSVSLPRET